VVEEGEGKRAETSEEELEAVRAKVVGEERGEKKKKKKKKTGYSLHFGSA
jgi:hypothetical protein